MILHAAVLLLPRERAIIIVEDHAKINNMENKRKALEDDCTQKTALPKVLILSKFSKDKSMERFKEVIYKMAPDSKMKNEKIMVVPFTQIISESPKMAT